MERKIGMPLKNDKGEIVKCELCGGIYKWDGSLLLTYPAKLPFYCDKCNSRLAISEHIIFPEEYPEFNHNMKKM